MYKTARHKKDLCDIYLPVKEDIESVSEFTMRLVRERCRETRLRKMLEYAVENSGKRVRSALVFLSGRAGSGDMDGGALRNRGRETAVLIASCIELIHMASLVHDDVIDHAEMRRNLPSVNSKFGRDASLVLGDYLYSLAFEVISDMRRPEILDCIASATRAMCEGELLQVSARGSLKLSKEHYLVVVKKKTASLFAAACKAGALTAGCRGEFISRLESFGFNFGIAYQILDDYLDIAADRGALGKMPGQDLSVGEFTLPFLYLLEEKELYSYGSGGVLTALKTNPGEFLRAVRSSFLNSSASRRTRLLISEYVNAAKSDIFDIPDSVYKRSLLRLADFVLKKAG